jgi:hypothetical protein
MMVGILWVAILGCSQDGSLVPTATSCAAPVIEPSESILGIINSPTVSTAVSGPWIRLKWDASSNTLGYRLYIGTGSQSYKQAVDVGLLTTSVVSILVSDMTYYFAVTAYNAAGESCPSNEVSAHIS